MKRLLLVSCFGNINLASNNRLRSVYDNFRGNKIVLASDFNHWGKRYYSNEEMHNPNQKHFHVISYNKNLSLRRIISHLMFAYNVWKFLRRLESWPDAIYCIMPTSSSAFVCARFCKKHNITFIVDVVDLWPDSLLPIVKYKKLVSLLISPWSYLTYYSYKSADVIMGESQKYVSVAKEYNAIAQSCPIYLGVDLDLVAKVKSSVKLDVVKPKDELWIGYAGNLGNSYDFNTLLDAVKSVSLTHKCRIVFVGDGDKRPFIEDYAQKNNLNITVTGYCSYENLLAYLQYCDIAVNIFRENTKVVYSYKFNDYVAMGCFILNSLEGETAEMVDNYQIGKNFNFTTLPLKKVLNDVVSNWDKYSLFRDNLPTFIDEKLDKRRIYATVNSLV